MKKSATKQTGNGGAWIGADEAAGLLGVNRSTLYAYVSRGHVRSEPVPGTARKRQYSRDDVDRLLSRNAERRDPGKAAAQTLKWGLPVLDSAITLIAGGRIYYRGHDAAVLAATRSLAEVANLIWSGTFADVGVRDDSTGTAGSPQPATPLTAELQATTAKAPFITRAQIALADAASRDPAACDLRPRAVVRSAWRILDQLVRVAVDADDAERTIDTRLAEAWGVPDAAHLIRAALILCADHELNVSAFTARCVASAGTHIYGVIGAALAALEGPRHGGLTFRVESLWNSVRDAPDLEQALVDRLRRGESIEGFGHPLYPAGDPRARQLLELLPPSAASSFALRLAAASQEILHERPALDFGLVAVRRALGLPDEAALMLFAIGRTIGWIGHAIEQYSLDTVIRPRARYVGNVPAGSAAADTASANVSTSGANRVT